MLPYNPIKVFVWLGMGLYELFLEENWMLLAEAPSWAETRGSPGRSELGSDLRPMATILRHTALGLRKVPENNPAEGGKDPPRRGIETILGRSRNVQRSDLSAGINGNAHPLYKVRSLLANYPRLFYSLWIPLTGRLTWPSECPRGQPRGSPASHPIDLFSFILQGLDTFLSSVRRTHHVSSVRGRSALLHFSKRKEKKKKLCTWQPTGIRHPQIVRR